jgi:polyisoprenoid-binding protein YceI
MNKSLIRIFLIFFLITSAISSTFTQSTFYLQPENSQIVIQGTSTVHDWHMDLKSMNSEIIVKSSEAEISSVHFSCKAKDLLSDNSIMNSKTQDALKSKKYPEITFISEKITSLTKNGNNIKGKALGTLSIAGVKKTVEIPFNGTISNPKISISGSKKILMSDFNMESPTAMLGALKTGNEISIKFSVVYKLK